MDHCCAWRQVGEGREGGAEGDYCGCWWGVGREREKRRELWGTGGGALVSVTRDGNGEGDDGGGDGGAGDDDAGSRNGGENVVDHRGGASGIVRAQGGERGGDGRRLVDAPSGFGTEAGGQGGGEGDWLAVGRPPCRRGGTAHGCVVHGEFSDWVRGGGVQSWSGGVVAVCEGAGSAEDGMEDAGEDAVVGEV